MGTWGTGLYSNDSTCDVRDTYMQFLQKGVESSTAYEQTTERCLEYIGSEDEPLFWFALAETMWRSGRLLPEVKEKALDWIKKDGGVGLWRESKRGITGWKKTLERLRIKLNTEQPREKRFRTRGIPFQNPWGINDVYAYRIHKESLAEKQRAVYGKYLLMQKIGEEVSNNSPDIVMRVQIFDRLFDALPSRDDVLDVIHNGRILPISSPLDQADRYRRRLQGKPDPFDWSEPLCLFYPVKMSAKMEQYYKDPSYPQSELTLICTEEGPPNLQHTRSDAAPHCSLMWHDFHFQIGAQFDAWSGVKYDVIGDGTFEYPTREQQMKIKSEVNATEANSQNSQGRFF